MSHSVGNMLALSQAGMVLRSHPSTVLAGACIKIKRLEVSAAGQTGSLSAGTNTVRAILLADSDITQTPPFHPLPLFRGTPVHKYNEFLNDSSTAVSGFDKEKVTLMVSIISITDKTDIGLVNVLVVDSKGDKTTVSPSTCNNVIHNIINTKTRTHIFTLGAATGGLLGGDHAEISWSKCSSAFTPSSCKSCCRPTRSVRFKKHSGAHTTSPPITTLCWTIYSALATEPLFIINA